jgi:hypothetical protein
MLRQKKREREEKIEKGRGRETEESEKKEFQQILKEGEIAQRKIKVLRQERGRKSEMKKRQRDF